FFRPRTHADSTFAAVVADSVHRLVHHGRVVNVVNDLDVHVEHSTVVEKVSAVPTSAFKTQTEVAKAVVNPAVEAHVRAPVAVPPPISAAFPTPISGSPQETHFRSQHPGSRHPIIIADVVVVGPVAGRPEITVARTTGLFIDRNRGR